MTTGTAIPQLTPRGLKILIREGFRHLQLLGEMRWSLWRKPPVQAPQTSKAGTPNCVRTVVKPLMTRNEKFLADSGVLQ
jgi:hypothetical protein